MLRFFVSIVLIFWIVLNTEAQTQKVLISTDYGDMKVELYDETPKHRDNFIKLVKDSFYNDLLFHRVIEGFMIQGGDPKSKNAASGKPLGGNGPGYTIDAEINSNFIHKKGALAAARLSDQANPKRESSGSQFYIVQGKVLNEKEIEEFEKKVKKTIIKEKITNYARSHREEIKRIRKEFSADSMRNYQIAAQRKIIKEIDESEYRLNDQQRKAYTTIGGTPFLDGKYTVFGQVIEGLSVIDSIAVLETDQRDRPVKDVKMRIRIINE